MRGVAVVSGEDCIGSDNVGGYIREWINIKIKKVRLKNGMGGRRKGEY
jgi:hypothetical protein